MFRRLSSGLGVRFCLAYLRLYYTIPLVIGYLFDYSYLDRYKGTPEYIYVLPAILAYFMVFISVYTGIPGIATPLGRIHVKTFSRPYLNLAIMHKFKSKFSLSKMRFSVDEVSGQREETRIIVADEGSILIADTKGLHRGNPIKKGRRYACTVYFFENKQSYDSFSRLIQRHYA